MIFNWIGKGNSTAGTVGSADVTITLSAETTKITKTNFRFRNECFKKIAKSGYIVFAINNNKVYFNESTESRGFKLTNISKLGDKASFQCNGLKEPIVGNYDLEYDKVNKLYFIDLEKKL